MTFFLFGELGQFAGLSTGTNAGPGHDGLSARFELVPRLKDLAESLGVLGPELMHEDAEAGAAACRRIASEAERPYTPADLHFTIAGEEVAT